MTTPHMVRGFELAFTTPDIQKEAQFGKGTLAAFMRRLRAPRGTLKSIGKKVTRGGGQGWRAQNVRSPTLAPGGGPAGWGLNVRDPMLGRSRLAPSSQQLTKMPWSTPGSRLKVIGKGKVTGASWGEVYEKYASSSRKLGYIEQRQFDDNEMRRRNAASRELARRKRLDSFIAGASVQARGGESALSAWAKSPYRRGKAKAQQMWNVATHTPGRALGRYLGQRGGADYTVQKALTGARHVMTAPGRAVGRRAGSKIKHTGSAAGKSPGKTVKAKATPKAKPAVKAKKASWEEVVARVRGAAA